MNSELLYHSTIKRILYDVFGYTEFRPSQEEIITAALKGKHIYAQLATGAGKSLCYQIPALITPGLTVVVSPLVALIHDQVEALRLNSIPALYLDSSLNFEERGEVYRRLKEGFAPLLYIAPERLRDTLFIQFLQGLKLARWVIDEAHCISQWGHDFRREYLALSRLPKLFPEVPRMAFTATADAATADEIIRTLQLTDGAVFTDYPWRENMRYYFVVKKNAKRQLLSFLASRSPDECGIVYCFSRRETEKTAAFLEREGYKTFIYHAGLPPEIKKANQIAFYRANSGIMVATVAFGLGIDKANIRFVARLNLPSSIEEFVQESGRAGRDGLPAVSWVCYGLNDYVLATQRIKQSEASPEQINLKLTKLRGMLLFCDTPDCRLCAFYRYFGISPLEHECSAPSATRDFSLYVRQLLSAIYHTRQNAAISEITAILRGKNPALREQYGLYATKIYGIGGKLSERFWRFIIRQSLGFNLAEVANKDQILRFTPEGKKFLQQKSPLYFKEEVTKITYPPFYWLKTEREKALHRALSQLRENFAAGRHLAGQYVFNDYTLEVLTQRKPQQLEELKEIPGLSPAQITHLGAELVRLCRHYQAL